MIEMYNLLCGMRRLAEKEGLAWDTFPIDEHSWHRLWVAKNEVILSKECEHRRSKNTQELEIAFTIKKNEVEILVPPGITQHFNDADPFKVVAVWLARILKVDS